MYRRTHVTIKINTLILEVLKENDNDIVKSNLKIIIKLYLNYKPSNPGLLPPPCSRQCTHNILKDKINTLILEVIKENDNEIVKSNLIIMKFKNTIISSHLPRITN